jgi:hypothetical protein
LLFLFSLINWISKKKDYSKPGKDMNKHPNKAKIQITDLIDESVSHAVARRQQAMGSEGFEIDLSGDENQIKGGVQSSRVPVPTVGLTYPIPQGSGELQ